MISLNSDEPLGINPHVPAYVQEFANALAGEVVEIKVLSPDEVLAILAGMHAPQNQGVPVGTYVPSDLAEFCKQQTKPIT